MMAALKKGPLDDKTWKLLTSLRDLKEIQVDGKQFSNEELARVCNIKSIEQFKFGYWTSVTETGLPVIARLPKLRDVEFRGTRFPLASTLEALASAPELSSIAFSGGAAGLSGEGIKTLGKLTRLTELSLDLQWVPDCTGSDFAHLSNLKNLRMLSLRQMVLTSEGGLAHLKQLKLKKLRLEECAVNPADLARLKQAMPDVKIEVIDAKDLALAQWNASLERYKKQGMPKHLTGK
jgi:hypothetical protein